MKKFLTTAPVFSAIWFTITAVIMIEFNHLFPDMLFSPFCIKGWGQILAKHPNRQRPLGVVFFDCG